MIINHNLTAMNTARQYNIISSNRVKSTEKLSSGYKINRAADDAAGLSISEKMRWQIRGLNKAVTNIQDGVSLVQVTDGALSEADSILQRMRELSVQAANDTNTPQDRQALRAEIDQNIKELNRIAETTTFNGIHTLRADDQYAVDLDKATITTPTAIGKGIYKMDKDDISMKDRNGNPSTTQGFEMSFSNKPTSELEGKTFFLTCSAHCNQTFDFSFDSSKPTGVTINSATSSPSIYINIKPGDVPNQNGIPGKIATLLGNDSNVKALYPNNGSMNNNYQIGHANMLYIEGSRMAFYPVTGHSNFSSSSYNKTVGTGASQITYNNLNMGTMYLNGMEENVIIDIKSNEWGLKIQAGALENQAIDVPLVWMEAKKLGIDPLDVSSFDKAGSAIGALDNALEWLHNTRSRFGAVQNRLEHAMDVDANTSLNTSSAESRLRDTDISEEMVNMAKQDILSSAGEAMLAQSNHLYDSVLSLLQ